MAIGNGLLSANDETIDDAVLYADPMVLRGLLFQLTGDEEVAAMDVNRPGSQGAPVVTGAAPSPLSENDITCLRAKAAAFLKAHRDRGAPALDIGPRNRLIRSLSLTAGAELPEAEQEMWLEQSALDPWARGVDEDRQPAPEAREDFLVAVIGAGLSGLNAAVHLKNAGIPYVLLEKNADVGGTWFENRYPGARVDSPSRTYTHIFGVNFVYPYAFCPQGENLKYMRWVAEEFGVRDSITFNTEVESIVWDEPSERWIITADRPEGRRTWTVNAVITCVGFLSRPNLPEIEGMKTFAGQSTHTAQWPEGLDITGKRVAVIGSGASGYQTTPEIAKRAAHVHLFQRTPSWCFDNQSYVRPLPDQAVWLDQNFPYYVNFARFNLSWMYSPQSVAASLRIDPAFDDPHAASAANKANRELRIAFLEKKLAGRPDLVEKMTPEAPPMSSRPVMIDKDDSIFDALQRGEVTLVTDAIDRITSAGIMSGGEEIPFDVIVYATGYKANDFLWPMAIRGRDGVKVEDLWAKDGARAYIGAMMPGFPNFFMAYGPNTNNFGGFQIVDLVEIEIRFALHCISGLIEQRKSTVDVTTDAYWRFNEELDREEKLMIYMDRRAKNYYQNEHGRSAVNAPIDFRRMWNWLRDPAGPLPETIDAGIKPYFGEDLVVN